MRKLEPRSPTKFTALTLCLILLLSLFPILGTAAEESYADLTDESVTLLSFVGQVTGSAQNVRAQPNATAALLTTLPNGAYLHITGIDTPTRWMRAEYAKNSFGYVSTLSGAASSATTAVLTSRVGQAVDQLYVRDAASESGTILGYIRADSFVLIVDATGAWYRILYDGSLLGYVEKKYVAVPHGVNTTVTNSPNASVISRALTNNPALHNLPGARGPVAYNEIIDQFQVETNTRFLPGGGFTYCNIYCWDVMTAMRVHFPHWLKPDGKTPYLPAVGESYAAVLALGCYEVNANTYYNWVETNGAAYGWVEVDPTVAQVRANNGFPTITTWKNPTGGSGHVQVVRPEAVTVKYAGATGATGGAIVSQAGSNNYNLGPAGRAYGANFPRDGFKYYTHDGGGFTVGGGTEQATSIHPLDPCWNEVECPNPPTPTPTPTSPGLPTLPPTDPILYGVVNTAGLNVRKGPGVQYDIIVAISQGAELIIYAEENGWYLVHVVGTDIIGWVSGAYVLIIDTPTPTPTPTAPPTPEPLRIRTPEELAQFAAAVNAGDSFAGKIARLENDIDMTDYLAPTGAGHNAGAGFAPIGTQTNPFRGTFEGGGFEITGLWINRPAGSGIGLFGYAQDASIQNLGVELAPAGVTGHAAVGGLVGSMTGRDIDRCYVRGGEVYGSDNDVGGLAGALDGVNLSRSYAATPVRGGKYYVGGLVGGQTGGAITNCYATGNVAGSYAGGLVGAQSNGAGIGNCYATGNVTGGANIGGLLGYQGIGSSIACALSTGNVSGTANVSAAVGRQYTAGSGILNCYRYDLLTVNGAIIPDSDPNSAPDKLHGESLTEEYFISSITYELLDWLFADVWSWHGTGYPKLNLGAEPWPWPFPPGGSSISTRRGDANCDNDVDAADAALILRVLAGLAELSQQGRINADVTDDNVIGADDAARILRFLAGLIIQL
ncbi:MAG: SH3 domain-containing protein [Clostridiales bacterium]|nr:SH3 domain-containing protein [Clostridiales bacterium]